MAGAALTGAGGLAIGLAKGATLGSVLGPWGIVIGAIAGLAVGAIAAGIANTSTGIASEREQAALDLLGEKFEEDPTIIKDREALKKALGDEYSDLADSLTENTNAL